MPKTKTLIVYDFDELSDGAKEQARAWYRDGDEFQAEHVIDDAVRVYAILGVTVDTRPVSLMNGSMRQDPCVYYSGFSSQGDGACFDGTYAYAKQSTHKIREYAPTDTMLHEIADTLVGVQKRYRYKVLATVKHDGRYTNPGNTTIDVETTAGNAITVADTATIEEALRDLMNWTYRQLEQEYEYQTSDAQVDENIRANEYEFTEEGRRA